jgi:hypothetical protein
MGIRGGPSAPLQPGRGGGRRGTALAVLPACRFVSSRGICVNRAWIRGDIDETGRSILSISSRGPEHKTWGRAAVRRDTLESFLTDCVFYIGPYCGHVFFCLQSQSPAFWNGPGGRAWFENVVATRIDQGFCSTSTPAPLSRPCCSLIWGSWGNVYLVPNLCVSACKVSFLDRQSYCPVCCICPDLFCA